jgi:hypothetical protein
MASGFPRVYALRFKSGRLVGGAELHDVRCVDGAAYRLIGGDDLAADVQRLPSPPRAPDVEALLTPGRHALRTRDGQTEWSAGPEAARLESRDHAWIVCVGAERAPEWLRALVDTSDAQVASRLLLGAMLKLPSGAESASPPTRAPRPAEFVAAPAGPGEARRLETPTLLGLGLGVVNTLMLALLLGLTLAARPRVPEVPSPRPSPTVASPPPAASPSPSVAPSPAPSPTPKPPRTRRPR